MTNVFTIKEGDSYAQFETDLAATLSGEDGNRFLDTENCFKCEIEVHFVKKRSLKSERKASGK